MAQKCRFSQGFMAIYHVNVLFPDLNDLPNLEALRRS
jgi:hypothetical protein